MNRNSTAKPIIYKGSDGTIVAGKDIGDVQFFEPSEQATPAPAEPVRRLEEQRQYADIDDATIRFNERFCFVCKPTCVVRLSDRVMFRVADFRTSYATHQYSHSYETKDGEKKTGWLSAPTMWLKSPRRNTADLITYAPGQDVYFFKDNQRYLNTWTGWAAEPKQGNIGPWNALLEFLIPKEDERKWFEQWVSYPIQNPGGKLMTAVVLYGPQGIGKDICAEAILNLYGVHGVMVKGRQVQADRFNAWLENHSFVIGDEVSKTKNPDEVIAAVKHYVTSLTVPIERKFIDAFDVPNHVNFLFTTNDPHAFTVANDDRRFCILEGPSKPFSPTITHYDGRVETLDPAEFYDGFREWKNSQEGIAALHYHLKCEVNLDGFDPHGHAPMTPSQAGCHRIIQFDSGRVCRGFAR